MRALPLCLLLALAACAAPRQPAAVAAPPVLHPGVTPLTLEQDRELGR